jgi:thymidylate kinase
MVEQERWLNRFANLWLACEKDSEIVHSAEPMEEKMGRLIRRELDAGISKENIRDQEEWLEKFANLWLACEKNHDKLFNKQEERGVQSESRVECESPEKPGVIGESDSSSEIRNHSSDVLSELSKGKVVVGDGFLKKSQRVSEERNVENETLNLEESELNPDDLILFDLDPEMAIKLLTSSRGKSL